MLSKAGILYTKEWKCGKINKRFWNEVLKGRTITKLLWGKERGNAAIIGFVLDNGEKVNLFPVMNIEVEECD